MDQNLVALVSIPPFNRKTMQNHRSWSVICWQFHSKRRGPTWGSFQEIFHFREVCWSWWNSRTFSETKSGSLGFRFPDGQKKYNLSKQIKNSYTRCHSHSVSFWLGSCLWWFPKSLLPSRHNEIVVACSQPAAKGSFTGEPSTRKWLEGHPCDGPKLRNLRPVRFQKKLPTFQGPRKFFVGQNISKCRREHYHYRSTCVKLSGTPNYFFTSHDKSWGHTQESTDITNTDSRLRVADHREESNNAHLRLQEVFLYIRESSETEKVWCSESFEIATWAVVTKKCPIPLQLAC